MGIHSALYMPHSLPQKMNNKQIVETKKQKQIGSMSWMIVSENDSSSLRNLSGLSEDASNKMPQSLSVPNYGAI